MPVFVKIPDKLESQISHAYLMLLCSCFFLSWLQCLLFEGELIIMQIEETVCLWYNDNDLGFISSVKTISVYFLTSPVTWEEVSQGGDRENGYFPQSGLRCMTNEICIALLSHRHCRWPVK